jgi:hypothetical protein
MEGCSVFWMLRFAFIIYLLSNLAKPFMDDHHLIYITKLWKGTMLCNLYSLKKKCTLSVEHQLVHKSLQYPLQGRLLSTTSRQWNLHANSWKVKERKKYLFTKTQVKCGKWVLTLKLFISPNHWMRCLQGSIFLFLQWANLIDPSLKKKMKPWKHPKIEGFILKYRVPSILWVFSPNWHVYLGNLLQTH